MIAFRELQAADLKFLIAVRNACRGMLHDDAEFSLEQAQEWFRVTRPRFYMVMLDNSPIGYFRTSNWDAVNGSVCVGCDLHADYQGKGLAREAYRIFLRFLFEHCGMNRVSLEVLVHNERAKRLYRRLGFVFEGISPKKIWRDGRHLESLVMSMRKSEFNSRYGPCEQTERRPAERASAAK